MKTQAEIIKEKLEKEGEGRNNLGRFVKGHVSHWKGKKRPPFTEEWKQKISETVKNNPTRYWKGKKFSKEHREKMSNENNHGWKGDKVSYGALHRWVVRKLGTPSTCEFCQKDFEVNYIDWANKSGSYKRDLSDWIRLCRKCHKSYEKTITITIRKK